MQPTRSTKGTPVPAPALQGHGGRDVRDDQRGRLSPSVVLKDKTGNMLFYDFPRGKTYEQTAYSRFLTIWCGHRCSCSCVRCSVRCSGGRSDRSAGRRRDGAAVLSGLLAELPAHVVQSTLCALIWVLLPLVCAFLRPRELLLSAVAAARGFVLAMTVAVSVGERKRPHHRSSRRTRRAERLRAACRMLYGLAGR